MKLAISKTLTTTAARRFADSYPPDKYPDDTKWGQTRLKLIATDPATVTAEEVAAIIGNKSWSHFTCDECGAQVEKAVELAQDYSERAWTFCPSCLRAAAALAAVQL